MKQRAYTLIFILPALLGMAVVLSAVVPTSIPSVSDLSVLSDARQRLIAYSATYIESYKPGGAGPGHLPCPDTDRSLDRYAVQSGLYGDGPNPPCGEHNIAIGRLPRHITHAAHRYAFHLEDKHALWYAVDTRFVNNPVNRVVNPGTVGRIRWAGQAQVAAVLFIPDEASLAWIDNTNANNDWIRQALSGGKAAYEFERALKHSVVVTPAALLSAVTQRVALWLRDRFALSLSACAAGGNCKHSRLAQCEFDSPTMLLLFILDNANKFGCAGSSPDESLAIKFINDSYLDGMLYRRHWFRRNGWWQYTGMRFDKQCVDLTRCKIRVRSNGHEQPLFIVVSAAS